MKKINFALKLLLSAALSGLILVMVSCTSMLVSDTNNPQLTWNSFSEHISKNDMKSAFEMSANADISEALSKSDFTALLKKNIADCYSFKYTADTDVLGVAAWQEMDITFLDVRKLAGQGIVLTVKQAEEHNRKLGSYKSDAEIKAAVYENLNAIIISPSDYINTEHIRVEFNYSDGVWKPVITDQLYDILSGYVRQADKAIDDGVEELKRTVTFKDSK